MECVWGRMLTPSYIKLNLNSKPWKWLGMVAHTYNSGLGRTWLGWGKSEPRL